MSTQCEHDNGNNVCRAYSMIDSKYCFWHNPKTAIKRSTARKKGGYNRRINKTDHQIHYPIKSIKDVNNILESAINDACALESNHTRLKTIGYLCKIALRGQELGSLEDRVLAIENTMGKVNRKS